MTLPVDLRDQIAQDQIVTRLEVAEHIEDVFHGQPVGPQQLIAQATSTHARSAVLDVLAALPTRTFRHLRDVWPNLPTLPIDRD